MARQHQQQTHMGGIAPANGVPAKPTGPDPLVIWNECEPAPAERTYIARKGGKPDGLKVYSVDAPPFSVAGCDMRGYLVVPAYNLQTGELLTLQFIPPGEGKKLNLPGHPMAGAFTIPATAQGACTYIVEGIGQAWSAATQPVALLWRLLVLATWRRLPRR
ncbi:MAG: hypothetical protein U1F63_09415 [Chitinivorax sp.]